MENMNINLTGVPETLFIPLRIRAIETMRSDALINDSDAVEILKKIKFKPSSRDKISKGSQLGTIARTILFDRIVDSFLKQNTDGVVVNLGCGLDARHKRFAGKYDSWFDLDVTEVIDLKRHFFEENERYKMVEGSAFEHIWMTLLPADKPTLFISEGVMMYFEEEKVRALFCEIANRFSKAEIAFDIMRKWTLKQTHPDVKKYEASFKWALDEGRELETWHPRISFKEELYFMDHVGKRMPMLFWLIKTSVPPFRKAFKIVRIKIE